MMGDTAVLWSVGGIELLKAVSVHHSYPRHWHDTYVVEVVERGANGFYCPKGTFTAQTGDLIVFHPGEVHTGYRVGDPPLHYRSIYPKPGLLAQIAAEIGGSARPPVFDAPIIQDSLLACEILRAHQLLQTPCDTLKSESLLMVIFGQLLTRHSNSKSTTRGETFPGIVLKPAIEHLNENFTSEISLQILSNLCGMSRFHFLRVFRATLGLPPFEYLTNLRVRYAKRMLASGKDIVESAQASGFYDQSHLNRHFKRIVGVTPGQYRAQ